MRKITYWALSTLTVLVLLFSYSTSRGSTISAASTLTRSAATTATTTTPTTTSPTDLPTTQTQAETQTQAQTQATPESDSGTSASDTTDAAGSGGTATSGTFVGDEVNTRWGIVQVSITVADGKITKSEVVQVPWENPRDQQINSQAVPVYNEETVQAQSADIDAIGGATVTWQGYTASLQSAIDQANI